MNDAQRDDLLLKLSESMSEVKAMLKQNNRALYGNGSDANPGLVGEISNMTKDMAQLDKRVCKLENTAEHSGKIVGIVSIVVSTLTAIWCAFFKK